MITENVLEKGYKIYDTPEGIAAGKSAFMEKAAGMGATHILWVHDISGIKGYVIARAYKCP